MGVNVIKSLVFWVLRPKGRNRTSDLLRFVFFCLQVIILMKKGKMKEKKTKKMDLDKTVNDSMKENYSDDDCDCNCHACDCCESEPQCECGPGSCDSGSMKEMTMEEMEQSLTDAASDVWMKLFLEACEKKWRKVSAKEIQKLAAEHVKRSKAEWKEKMKGK